MGCHGSKEMNPKKHIYYCIRVCFVSLFVILLYEPPLYPRVVSSSTLYPFYVASAAFACACTITLLCLASDSCFHWLFIGFPTPSVPFPETLFCYLCVSPLVQHHTPLYPTLHVTLSRCFFTGQDVCYYRLIVNRSINNDVTRTYKTADWSQSHFL